MITPAALAHRANDWQQRHRLPGVAWAVQKKYGDDNAGLWVVALSWYGFTAIFPLLLAAVTVLGYIGQASLGAGLVATMKRFPIIGPDLQNNSPTALHGNAFALVVGLLGLLYGAQGVTATAGQAMAAVWNVPIYARPGWLPRLGRSFAGLFTIAFSAAVNAFVTGYATGVGRSWLVRVPIIAGILIFNVASYWLTFRVLTPRGVRTRALLPGCVLGGIAFTALITIGTGLIQHTLQNRSNTYGTFSTVIGMVAFLALLAKLTIYAAELNPVLHRRLYPRQFLVGDPTRADEQVWHDLVHQERRRKDQRIGVGFGDAAPAEAATDAREPHDPHPQPEMDDAAPRHGSTR